MKLYITIILVIFNITFANSQTYEVGGFFGGANFIGDVGKTTYIAPNTGVFGAIFKWNRSQRHSFRGSVLFAKIEGDDSDSNDSRRKERGYSFKNNIMEISAGIEFTFWEFNMYSGKPASTPYLYSGITYFWYEALYKPANGDITDYDGAASFAIPMALGYKTTVGKKFVFAAEIGARYTFTDDLDGSNPVKGLEDNEGLKFGNVNNNDWYVFTGLTITYTFGRKPCYCNF